MLILIMSFTEIVVAAFLTQAFYCPRVAILTKSKFAVGVIATVRDNLLSTYYIA